jgi:hypothetical protein
MELRTMTKCVWLALGAACLAGAAAAQSDDDLRAAVLKPSPAAARPALDLSRLNTTSASPDAGDPDAAKTAVDHRFVGSGLTGSVGYLCGLDSYPHDAMPLRGPASSYGRDSTFLGAKLSYAFR